MTEGTRFQRGRHYLAAIAVLATLIAFLAWAVWIMITVWTSIDADLGVTGWVALSLGVFLSCVVGFGLMGLLFFSSRRGYDEPPTFDVTDRDTHDQVD